MALPTGALTYTAVFTETKDGWWLGWVEEVPGANAQERTLDEARQSLRDAVALLVEEHRTTIRDVTGEHPVIREPLALE